MKRWLPRIGATLLVLAGLQGCANFPAGAPAVPDDAAQPEAAASVGTAPDAEPFERGIASWYGLPFHGRRTASGERFDMNALTAAHPTLPFGTRVKVRSAENGREVIVRINDRGPFVRGRIIDLSHAAARAIGLLSRGTKAVTLTVLGADGG